MNYEYVQSEHILFFSNGNFLWIIFPKAEITYHIFIYEAEHKMKTFQKYEILIYTMVTFIGISLYSPSCSENLDALHNRFRVMYLQTKFSVYNTNC